MDKKRLWNGISQVMMGRIAVLLSSLATGFVLPKVLGVTDYGYLKIYTLYAVYTALLHCGFVDGILLKYAGESYEEVNRQELRSCSQFFLLFQTVFSVIFWIASFFTPDLNYRIIVCTLGVQLLLNNVTTYYQFISQATQRFREYSIRSILQALSKTVLVLVLLFGKSRGLFRPTFAIYIFVVNLIDAALLLWYIITYKEITFGVRMSFRNSSPLFKELFQVGIPLTLAYQAAQLVFALDRQFVSVLFDTQTYGIYAFAYSVVHMVSQIISSASVVLLPSLKQLPEQEAERYYPVMLKIVMMIAGAALVGYFPLEKIIQWYLPDYQASLIYLRIVLPTLIYTCCISVVMFTFYKIEGRSGQYLKICCIVLGIGFLLNLGAYKLGGTAQFISWASVVTVAIWFLIAGNRFSKKRPGQHIKNFMYILILSTAFYAITALPILWWQGALFYLLVYCILTYRDLMNIVYRKTR